jgi:hypothetical protein
MDRPECRPRWRGRNDAARRLRQSSDAPTASLSTVGSAERWRHSRRRNSCGQRSVWQNAGGGSAPPSTGSGPIQMGNGPVQAGQTNPHLPGFNPSSVPFINTPVGGAPGVTGSLGGAGTPGAGPTGGASPQHLSLLAQLFQGGGAGAPAAAAGGGGLLGGLAGLFA